jgi:hypothetical protein
VFIAIWAVLLVSPARPTTKLMKGRIVRIGALRAAVLAAFVSVSACANVMRDVPNPQIAPAPAASAKVVFMRTTFVSGGIECDLFEIVNGEPKFIGQIPKGNKVVYETTPGPKVFMAYGHAADFMLAELAPGKTYYSIVRPNWGSGGFAPTPIHDPNNPEAQGWISRTRLIEPDPAKASAWFAEQKARVQEAYVVYWGRFENKDAEQKKERTLQPQDGLVTPVPAMPLPDGE